MISCRARLVTMDETWLYHYDPETKQQSMEWRHSGSPLPKYSDCKNPLENFSPRFCGMKTAFSSLIIFQRAKLSTRSITHLCWCNWRIFSRKNAAGSSPSGSCSCMTMPRLTGHLQPRRNWPTWASSALITHSVLRIWPRRTTTCSLDWKTIEISGRNFSSDAEVLLMRRPGWTDNLLNFFFWVVCKSYSNGLRSVLSFLGEVCWINLEFCHCSLRASWSGQGLISTHSQVYPCSTATTGSLSLRSPHRGICHQKISTRAEN